MTSKPQLMTPAALFLDIVNNFNLYYSSIGDKFSHGILSRKSCGFPVPISDAIDLLIWPLCPQFSHLPLKEMINFSFTMTSIVSIIYY